jgi:hypothetical protein
LNPELFVSASEAYGAERQIVESTMICKRKLGVWKDATTSNPFGCWIFL